MTNYFKAVLGDYVLGVGETENEGNITEEEYNTITEIIHNKPTAPEGYAYELQDITYQWQLVERPTDESEAE